MVNKWVKPSLEGGKGPTKSTWMWLKRFGGTWIESTGVCTCQWIFALAHSWQLKNNSLMLALMAVQTNDQFHSCFKTRMGKSMDAVENQANMP